MINYKTINEKSIESGVSSGHIQQLCKNGKIDGAIKRGGVWFIPDNVTIPRKNMKSGAEGFCFIGTKKKIFNSAIKLFMLNGFDRVSMNDIADDIGIKQSTIYNHFKSKQEILETIYNFYTCHYNKDRPSLDHMKSVINEKSPLDVINCFRYDFEENYRQQMLDITKIILHRTGIDDKAAEISKSLMFDEGIRYVEDVLNIGIECDRFTPFDTYAMAVFINSIRLFVLYNWLVDPSPENMMKLNEGEQKLYQGAVTFMTDFKCPEGSGYSDKA